jgi:hypothetical protein
MTGGLDWVLWTADEWRLYRPTISPHGHVREQLFDHELKRASASVV